MKNLKLLFCAVFILIPSGVYAQDLRVAAAANLQSVLPELVEAFKKENRGEIEVVFGSSGKLTAQIQNGAPFDIFVSADMKYPQALYEQGLTFVEPQVYAYGTLVLWSTRNIDLSKGVTLLADNQIKKIAIANPQLAPYGVEAINVIKHYNLYKKVQNKLVYGESISQANDFIVSQAADIGITSKSTVLSPHLKEKGVWIEVSRESYSPIAQGVVMLLKASKEGNLQAANDFFYFLFSEEAKRIFIKYGYGIDK